MSTGEARLLSAGRQHQVGRASDQVRSFNRPTIYVTRVVWAAGTNRASGDWRRETTTREGPLIGDLYRNCEAQRVIPRRQACNAYPPGSAADGAYKSCGQVVSSTHWRNSPRPPTSPLTTLLVCHSQLSFIWNPIKP